MYNLKRWTRYSVNNVQNIELRGQYILNYSRKHNVHTSLVVLGTGTGTCTCMQSTGTCTGTWIFSTGTGTGTWNKVLVAKKKIFLCCWDPTGVATSQQKPKKLRLWLIFGVSPHFVFKVHWF